MPRSSPLLPVPRSVRLPTPDAGAFASRSRRFALRASRARCSLHFIGLVCLLVVGVRTQGIQLAVRIFETLGTAFMLLQEILEAIACPARCRSRSSASWAASISAIGRHRSQSSRTEEQSRRALSVAASTAVVASSIGPLLSAGGRAFAS